MIGYNNYQELANMIPEQIQREEQIECKVFLNGMNVGNLEVYGEVTAIMIFDEEEGCFVPVSVKSFSLTDQDEKEVKVSSEVLNYAMQAAYDRFGNYFDSSNVEEI